VTAVDPLPVLGAGLDHRRWRDRIRALRDLVDELTVCAYSDDGLVSATVSGRGELLALTLDPRVYRASDSRRLAESIMNTVRDATDQVRTRIAAEFGGRRS
jgi:DNA-binding protein YbaB